MTKLIFISFFLTAFFSRSQVCSSLLYPVSLEEKCNYASSIVYGEVIEVESAWDIDKNNIYTISKIKVYEIVKGNVEKEIKIAVQGGEVEGRIQINSNMANLSLGFEGVFFLKPSTIAFDNIENSYKLSTSIQGFVKLDVLTGELKSVFDHFQSTNALKSSIEKEVNKSWKQLQIRPNISKAIVATEEIPEIIGINPQSVTAGTKSVLTIDGNNFGVTQGKVGFRNADEGGRTFADALDIQVLSWSDTQIRVEVPFNAGTGEIRVANAIGDFGFSNQDLLVPYSLSNFHTVDGDAVFQPLLFDNNGVGGYSFVYHEEFAASDAIPFFEDAFRIWKCETGINFTFSGTTTKDTTADDGENVVRFDNGSEIEPGVLGAVITRSNGRCPFDNLAAISEQDYIWNDDINWHFGFDNPSFNQVDFKSVALHEHGHSLQLGHVIDPEAVMHFAANSGQVSYELSNDDIEGAQFAIDKFLTGSVCRGLGIITLETDNEDPEFTLSVFPANQEVEESTEGSYVLEDYTSLVIATDNCTDDDNIEISQSPVSGTNLPVGEHIVTMTARDEQGNLASNAFTLTVVSQDNLSVENINGSIEVNIFPNPVISVLTIDTPVQTQSQLIGVSGAILNRYTGNMIDLQSYPKGVYFLRIEIEGKEIVEKIIKD